MPRRLVVPYHADTTTLASERWVWSVRTGVVLAGIYLRVAYELPTNQILSCFSENLYIINFAEMAKP
jgi:hypothetical protein